MTLLLFTFANAIIVLKIVHVLIHTLAFDYSHCVRIQCTYCLSRSASMFTELAKVHGCLCNVRALGIAPVGG